MENKINTFKFTPMETVKCPICEKSVTPLSRTDGRKGIIVHENEHYSHVIRMGQHYLIRSTLNIKEEMPTLILN